MRDGSPDKRSNPQHTEHTERPPMMPSQTLHSTFFQRLMERLDPLQTTVSPEVQHAQVQCGRWLALQRLQLHWTTMQLARRIGAASQNLSLLEAGLGHPELLAPTAVAELESVLREGPYSAPAGVVLAHALGQIRVPDAGLLQQVANDLDSSENQPGHQDIPAAVTQVPTWVQQDPDMRIVLEAFFYAGPQLDTGGVVTYAAVRSTILGNLRLDDATAGACIRELRAHKLVVLASVQRDEQMDHLPQRFYELTTEGRRVAALLPQPVGDQRWLNLLPGMG